MSGSSNSNGNVDASSLPIADLNLFPNLSLVGVTVDENEIPVSSYRVQILDLITAATPLGDAIPPAAPGLFYATPATGAPASPALRAIAASDIPMASNMAPGIVQIGTATGTAADGGVVAGYSASIAAASSAASTALSVANAALPFTSLGAADGVAALDAAATVSGNTVIATASGLAPLALGDLALNLNYFCANQLLQPTATNLAGIALATNITTNFTHLTPQPGVYSNTAFGLGTFNPNDTRAVQNTAFGFGALPYANAGQSSTAFGFGALNSAQGGGGLNDAFGARALVGCITGNFNVAVGSNSLAACSTGVGNTAIGHGGLGGLDYVGPQPFGGYYCTALGIYALQGSISGQYNIAIGYYSGRLLNCYLTAGNTGTQIASHNTFIGNNIGYSGLGNGNYNVLVGDAILYNSGSYTTTGYGNIQVAPGTLSTVGNCAILGYGGLSYATTGSHSGMGFKVLNSLTTGDQQCAFGWQAALNITTGSNGVYGGWNVAASIYAGGNNIYLGNNTGSNGVIALGTVAGNVLTIASGAFTNGAGNLAVGQVITMAGLPAGTTITSLGTGTGGIGTYNLSNSATIATATIFTTADYTNTVCIGNSTNPTNNNQVWLGNASTMSFFVGGSMGLVSVTGGVAGHTSVGAASLLAITTAINASAFGINALYNLTTGNANSAYGFSSLKAMVSGINNAAFGDGSLNVATSNKSSAFGSNVASNLTTGNSIVAFGYNAGNGLITANNSIVIGSGAGTVGDFGGTVIIGFGAQASAANTTVINPTASPFILGNTFSSTGSGASAAAVFTGSISAVSATFTGGFSAASYTGQTTGTAVAAGNIGETILSNIIGGSAVTLTTATPANVTSITLSAGDWDVSADLSFNPSATMTVISGAITANSATLYAYPSTGSGGKFSLAGSFTNAAMPIGSLRVLITPAMVIAATNIIYLVAQSTFASGTNFAYGYLAARRRS